MSNNGIVKISQLALKGGVNTVTSSKTKALRRSGAALVLGIFCLKLLERVYLHVLRDSVELLLGVFVFVLLPAEAHANAAGHVADPVRPEVSVEALINADVLHRICQ